jgi:o-succinylbenzoate synthase
MSVPVFNFFRYAIPLRDALTFGNGPTMTSRRGLLVRCRMDDAEGWGEIAPLDGYSRETMAEVEREILSAESFISPSLKCGMDWAATALQQPGPTGRQEGVEIARLIAHDQSVIEAEPGSTVKVKVGRAELQQDIKRVRQLMDDHPGIIFRLDANRAWSLEDAVTFARAVENERLAFIEEPLRDFAEYEVFDQQSPVGFALDESLVDYAPWPWRNLRALVIKPTLLGGFSVVDELIQWAFDHDRYAVISSMYESGVGIRRLAAMAAERTPDVPAGLDTYSRLAGDVLTPGITMQHGTIKLNDVWQVDMDKLEQIA